jgi:hypothetical protein
MARTLDEVIASLPEAERSKIAARARELIAEEMSLQEPLSRSSIRAPRSKPLPP